MLNALGRREEALAATEEAVGLYRRPAQARPDAFLPDLAGSLNNLGNRLNALGLRGAPARRMLLWRTAAAISRRRDLSQCVA